MSLTDIMLVTSLTWSFIETTTIYKEVLINAPTNISCIPNEDIQIQWIHTPFGGSENFVYAGGSFYASPSRGFRLEKDSNTGPYHLVIPNARDEDAGLYECKEDTGSRVFGSTQLTVLESSPVCKSNMNPEGYVGPNTCKLKQDDMTFTCAVSFKGRPPRMTWKTINGSHSFNESTCIIENGRIDCRLTIRADSKYDGSIFNCQTTNSSFNCSTGIVKIHYFERQMSPVEVEKKNISDKVNCSVKSNQIIEYKWTRLEGNQYVALLENQELLIQIPGFYRCEVEYSISNVVCKAFGSEVGVLYPSITDCETDKALTAGVSVLSIIVAILGIVGIGLVVYLRKKTCKNKEGSKTEMNPLRKPGILESGGGQESNGSKLAQ